MRMHLKSKGIPTGVYYPIPGHAQKAFTAFDYEISEFSESARAASEVLSLPMHTELNEKQQNYICDAIRIFVLDI